VCNTGILNEKNETWSLVQLSSVVVVVVVF